MRAVIQRVLKAKVTTKNVAREIEKGLLILIGFEDADNEEDANWLSRKIVELRIFDDEYGIMNKSIKDINGDILIVSQFTLYASTKKGNRPSWIRASKPEEAQKKYDNFVKLFENSFGRSVKTGEFREYMVVDLQNDGPVTIIIDTKNKE